MKTYHFISGLPRSGTTLLSAILKQNPRFSTGISDPLAMYINSIIKDTGTAAGMEAVVSIDKRRQMIRDLFDSYYKENKTDVCFNTNRGWSAETALLADLFPTFKMIVCVREIPWILDSFEQLNAKNPYTIKPLYGHQQLSTVYERSNMLMGQIPNFPGYVAGPLANVKQSLFCNERKNILYIEYDTLVCEPLSVLKAIYNFIGEPWFNHDLNSVEDSYDEFDQQTKIVGLHTVRKKVEFKQRVSILPGDLWQQYESASFWRSNFDQIKSQLNWVPNVQPTTQSQLVKQSPQSIPQPQRPKSAIQL
jgi:sulfotransferase